MLNLKHVVKFKFRFLFVNLSLNVYRSKEQHKLYIKYSDRLLQGDRKISYTSKHQRAPKKSLHFEFVQTFLSFVSKLH